MEQFSEGSIAALNCLLTFQLDNISIFIVKEISSLCENPRKFLCQNGENGQRSLNIINSWGACCKSMTVWMLYMLISSPILYVTTIAKKISNFVMN